ncbi:cation efflux protein [Absidia repens]|uniref:Cation efflux protein n=1 Tax=Absidia repens TaxID=90262 RepID=A0A1X2IZJ4_9FUNG|nr:cation efflux protein [Absidia repens]
MEHTGNGNLSERTPLLSADNKHVTEHSHHRSPSRSGSMVSYQDDSCANISEQGGMSDSTKRKLWFATGLALVFFFTELVAGWMANSLALFSDAFHLLSDVVSFLVALVAIYLAEKPPTSRHTYGFHRAEVIAALVSVITIWILTAFLVREAIERVKSPQEIDAKLMCVTASIGVVINIILAYVLGGHHHGHGHSHDDHDHGHGHSHGNDCDEEHSTGGKKQHKKEDNINLRAAALHVIGDLLASIGILISSIILLVNPKLTIVDPICTFIFSLLVLYTTYHLVKDSLAVLMEGVPQHIKPEQIEKSLLQVPGVVAVHDLHVWVLSPGKSSLTAHISIDRDAFDKYDDILTKSQRIICDMYGVHHSTLQIESDQSNFQNHCRPQICTPRN